MKFFVILGLVLIGASIAFVQLSDTPATTNGEVTSDAVQTISSGDTVDLPAHLEPGVWTLVDFTADW